MGFLSTWQTARFHGRKLPAVDDDAREAYALFLDGGSLPGREDG